NRPAVAHTSGSVRVARQRDQRLGDPLEPELHQPVTALQGRTRAVYSLQRPRVAVRPAQLTGYLLRRRTLGSLEELVQTRDAERALRLELGQQVAEPRQRGMRRVMIGADEHRDVLAGGALRQCRANLRPDVRQARPRARQCGADLVALG